MAKFTMTCLTLLALAITCSTARQLQQSSGQVSPTDLLTALSKINQYSKVPDTSSNVAKVSNYNQTVAALQGPAAEIVQVSKDLTASPPAANQTEVAAALKAYGAQSGKSSLSPTGSKVYDAYTAITNALGFNSANVA